MESEIKTVEEHSRSLQEHQEQLAAVRPLYSTLYNDSKEIWDLSISFLEEAKEIYAIGLISSLSKTERKPDETEADYRKRSITAGAKTMEYVAANRDYILSGRKYCRIMDLNPSNDSDESIFEILSNINFFRRLVDSSATELDLHIYHNPEILKGRGDFHFKCSDRQVIFRAGGHGNEYTNIAISITDTRVVHEYHEYYHSLIRSGSTHRLEWKDLERLGDLLSHGEVQSARNYLLSLSGAVS